MSYENPTPLRVGATGTLNGWRARVAGRLVMGMQLDGETYYWNEYHLLDDSQNSAMLVYEETEHGPEWKLFREFTPTHPLGARDAARKRVGETVNLDGTPTPITLVGASRVFHVEGVAPEGVETGDIANYFNVDTGSRMLVASWTGDEIEFYEGLDAPADAVATAFGFPRAATSRAATASFSGGSSGGGGGPSLLGRRVTIFALLAFGLVTAFGLYSCFGSKRGVTLSRPSAPLPKQPAPALRLPTGARGSLAQHTYVIAGQAVVEIARINGRHDRREYLLHDEEETNALLVNGLSGGSKEWHLLRPAPSPRNMTPFDAATKRRGFSVSIEDRLHQIADLFQSKTLSSEGAEPVTGPAGAVRYGFVARDGGDWVVARWTDNDLQFFRGPAVPEADVLAALGRAPGAAK